LWDWKGPLGQSPKARPIQILFRASGKGKLEVSYTRYHDDWDGGKLKRKFFPTEKGPAVELTDKVQNYTVDYTIKPEEWIALWFFSKEGAVIENVSVILK
ncbi:MAG TPA: hypothetical protein PLB87_01890, partial [Prolixibacteraceae bacterium]|nr:hypothetical protein [Prolixibacteraceae bacterium]